MAFSVFFSITLLLFISFVVTKRNLHLFEILFMWMIIIFIHHTFLTVTAVNLKLITFTASRTNFWTLVFNRITLIPLLIIWFVDISLSVTLLRKLLLLPVSLCILVGIEYLGDLFNIYHHVHWKVWWSVVEWTIILLFVYINWIWFRKILRRELNVDRAPS
jgi:hypothetical protein